MKSISQKLLLIVSLLQTSNLFGQECLKNWNDTQKKVLAIQGALDCQNSPNLSECQQSLGLLESSMAVGAAVKAGQGALDTEKLKLKNKICELPVSKGINIFIPFAFAANDCALREAKGQTQLAIQSGRDEAAKKRTDVERKLAELDSQIEQLSNQGKDTLLTEDEYLKKVDEIYENISNLPEVKSIDKEISALEKQKASLSLKGVVSSQKRQEIIAQGKIIQSEIKALQQKKQNLEAVRQLKAEKDRLHIEQEKARSARNFRANFGSKAEAETAAKVAALNSQKVALVNDLNYLSRMQKSYDQLGKKVNSSSSITQIRSSIAEIEDMGAVSQSHMSRIRAARGVVGIQANSPGTKISGSALRFGKSTVRMLKFAGGGALTVAGEAMAASVDENCLASDMNGVLDQRMEDGKCDWDLELNERNSAFFFDSEEDIKTQITDNPSLCDFIEKTYVDNFPKAKCESGFSEIKNIRGYNSLKFASESGQFPKTLKIQKGMEYFSAELGEDGKIKNVTKEVSSNSRKAVAYSRENTAQKNGILRASVQQEEDIKTLLQLSQHQILQVSACCSQKLPRPTDRFCAEMGTPIQHKNLTPSSQSTGSGAGSGVN